MLRLVSLCLCGTRLCEAGSAFLALADEDDSTTNSTTFTSTTHAPTITTAVPHADVADLPQAIVIRGATGDAKVVNGRYKAADNVLGYPSWVKVKDTHVRLAFVSNVSGGTWHVESDMHEGGLLQGECEGQCLLSDVKSWKVKKGKAWTSETVNVGSLDETFSSDWLAPTLTVLAALMAVATASVGAGSLQKGSELCSMSGTWLSDSECYSVTATTPTFLPSFLLSLLGVAFPVPIPGGDLQLRCSSRHAPLGGESTHDVRMEFHKASHEPSSLIWQSDDGATIRRLSGDSAEFTLPGLEKCLLCRVPENDRTRMLPVTWLLLACVWFRPPVAISMAGLFVAFGLLQLAVSYAASRLGVQWSLRGAHHVVREVVAVMPFLFLSAFDFFSQTLTGSIVQVALLSLHMLSLLGPRLLAARPNWVSAACLVGWLVAALACIFFYVGLLLQSDAAWAFDRSKATVALACLGSWLAVPMQIGSHSLAGTTELEVVTRSEGSTEESLSWSVEAGVPGVGGGKKVGSALSTGSTSTTVSLLSAASTSDWQTLHSVQRMPSHLSDVSAAFPLSATVHAAPLRCSSSVHDIGIPSRQGSVASMKSTRSLASSRSSRSYAPSVATNSLLSEGSACMVRPGEAVSAPLPSSKSPYDTSIPSRQGSAASMRSTRSKANSRSSQSKAPNAGNVSLSNEGGALMRSGEVVASGSVSTAPLGKDDLLLAILQVGESREPWSPQVVSHASSGRDVDQESLSRITSLRRSHSRIHSPRAGSPQDSLQSVASLQSPRTLQDASAASSDALLAMATKRKRKHAKLLKGHRSASLGVGAVTDDTMLPTQESEQSVSLTSSHMSMAAGLERSRSAGPSRSVSGSSVTSSLQRQSCRMHSELPRIRAAPGDRLMFVNRTGHEYDERCQEYEIVTVVKVGGSPPMKVQWQSGFMQRVRMEDLSEMPSLPSAGGTPETEAIPDMPGDSDRRPRRVQKSRSPSRRAIPRMPDMPTLEGGLMDF